MQYLPNTVEATHASGLQVVLLWQQQYLSCLAVIDLPIISLPVVPCLFGLYVDVDAHILSLLVILTLFLLIADLSQSFVLHLLLAKTILVLYPISWGRIRVVTHDLNYNP